MEAMDASEYVDDGEFGEGAADFLADPAAQRAAQQMAESIANEARQQLDPLVAQQRAEEAEAYAGQVAALSQLADSYPELGELPVLQAVVDDAHRAAVELGIPESANDPGFWRFVHEARQAGARGGDVAYAIAERKAVEEIVTGGSPGAATRSPSAAAGDGGVPRAVPLPAGR
jgi:hypothetical protein